MSADSGCSVGKEWSSAKEEANVVIGKEEDVGVDGVGIEEVDKDDGGESRSLCGATCQRVLCFDGCIPVASAESMVAALSVRLGYKDNVFLSLQEIMSRKSL